MDELRFNIRDIKFYAGILLALDIALADFDHVMMAEVILTTIDADACLSAARYLNWEPRVVLYIERHIRNRIPQLVETR